MITAQEKESIERILGSNFNRKIADHLKSMGVKNSQDKYHTRQAISHIVNGTRENKDIEGVIFKYAYDELNRQRDEKVFRDNFVEQSKNVA
ncbi:hypothetical protein ACE939_00715 [Aquimarina sp. W85]|uniref:hypothetical protein n=1 Tax=Aquimarina rhodophyticola TaxID=3342246 RepID=UPI0036713EBB